MSTHLRPILPNIAVTNMSFRWIFCRSFLRRTYHYFSSQGNAQQLRRIWFFRHFGSRFMTQGDPVSLLDRGSPARTVNTPWSSTPHCHQQCNGWPANGESAVGAFLSWSGYFPAGSPTSHCMTFGWPGCVMWPCLPLTNLKTFFSVSSVLFTWW